MTPCLGVSPSAIWDFVIVKALPVLQCPQCGETEVEHAIMLRVDQVLAGVDRSWELEVIRFAA
jgi:hypothetical protein